MVLRMFYCIYGSQTWQSSAGVHILHVSLHTAWKRCSRSVLARSKAAFLDVTNTPLALTFLSYFLVCSDDPLAAASLGRTTTNASDERKRATMFRTHTYRAREQYRPLDTFVWRMLCSSLVAITWEEEIGLPFGCYSCS